ncbi:MAG: YihY/virulence factor BrkB family protein [Ligilactobacillus acidipiscis]|jgi:membrane protein|nr:YihY/virulence factor BrkB family protein [Ligilactobacillus acidipiscis]MCI1953785.1 YihY/virulence factor BrkB family protein [Ligilactobacillus acidipiscis]
MDFGKKFQPVKKFVRLVIKQFGEVNIGNTAIVTAYYSLLAIFPMLIFITNLLPMLGLKADTILPYLQTAFPSTVFSTIKPIVMDFLNNSSGSLASVTGILTIWSASRGVNALKMSINQVYGVKDYDNAITSRIFSFFMILLFAIIVIVAFVVNSFGQIVLEYLTPIFHLSLGWLDAFSKYKSLATLVIIFLVMVFLYVTLTNAKTHLRYVWPGALFAAAGWMILTQGFSIYLKYFAKSVLSYGTIGTFIVLLFWLNFSSWLILLGALLNSTLERYHYGKIEPKKTAIKRLYDRVDPMNKDNSKKKKSTK